MSSGLHEELTAETKKQFEAVHADDPYESAISALNESFHDSYGKLIQKVRSTLGLANTPVIVMHGSQATLFHDGGQETAEVIPYLYHLVKAISHVSFGIYVTLAHNGEGPLTVECWADMAVKRGLLNKALAILDEEPIPANYVELQRRTLESALAIVTEVMATSEVSEARVTAYGSENAPLYLENAALGTILELDVLHETVMGWKTKMGPEAWEALHVVVCGGHQARYREASKQYFQRLLHDEDGQGASREDRVIYAEHIYEMDAALNLLARHLVDQRASIALFDSRTRLQQDLMSDGATAYLRELLPA